MAELSLKNRLQPALLDRLSDDERMLTVFRIVPIAGALAGNGLALQQVHRLLATQGLQPQGATESAIEAGDETAVLEYSAPGRTVTPTQLRALKLPGAAGREVQLHAVCRIETSTAFNTQIESADRRTLSTRRLREAVLRDLGWLLNSFNLEEIDDLALYPEVRRSVLNYGMTSYAGRIVSAIDAGTVASHIAETLSFFEPRLSSVRVTPDLGGGETGDGMTLTFRVEAELWGQPMTQHLSLRTSIDFVTGDAKLLDDGARG
jgi:type VI secretion system protein ImpF